MKSRPRKNSRSPKSQLKAKLARLALEYAHCIARKNYWAQRAENVAIRKTLLSNPTMTLQELRPRS